VKPTGAMKEKHEAALLKALDKQERLELELKELGKDKREEIKDAKAEVKRNRDLLAGREHEEDELPFDEPDHAGRPRARGPGLSIAMADNGVGVPPGEVAAAKEELRRKGKAKGKAGDEAIDVTPRPGQKALPPARKHRGEDRP